MFKQVKNISSLDKIEDSIRLGNLFVQHGIVTCLGRDHRQEAEAKKKYPKHVLPMNAANQRMTEKYFYMWNIERSSGKLAFMLILVILLVVAFLLFNIWPLWLKIGLWYFSFYLLMLLVNITFYFNPIFV